MSATIVQLPGTTRTTRRSAPRKRRLSPLQQQLTLIEYYRPRTMQLFREIVGDIHADLLREMPYVERLTDDQILALADELAFLQKGRTE